MELKRFEKKVYLSSPTMHGEELKYMKEAFDTNWMSTVGKNIDEVERLAEERIGIKYAVGLSCGTAATPAAPGLWPPVWRRSTASTTGHPSTPSTGRATMGPSSAGDSRTSLNTALWWKRPAVAVPTSSR